MQDQRSLSMPALGHGRKHGRAVAGSGGEGLMSGRAVLYAAKSTADIHGSIPAQLEDGRALAGREGLEVVGEYSEVAASAYGGDRGPEPAVALEHRERGEAR